LGSRRRYRGAYRPPVRRASPGLGYTPVDVWRAPAPSQPRRGL